MVFSSLTFLLVFLPVMLLLYYLVPKKTKNFILVIGSLVFYVWGEPVYVVLMVYSILFNYVFGILMDDNPGYRKLVLVSAVVVNVLVLAFFKYYGFVVNTINNVFGISLRVRDIPLPIGISFYTFQALSYIIDLYRGKFKAQRNLISFAAYITMFPQLIAGPIVRYEDIEKQLSDRKLSPARFGYGCTRFVYGLSKKVLLANSVGMLFDSVRASGGSVSVVSGWIGAMAYTFQIYFDFSGYSDMAIGLGQMLGFTFNENFNDPYMAASVTDFWRRWHISLGSWFREYVYIPLGGNRVSVPRHIFNMLVVWLLTGAWHGAGWNFILWGLYYGILLIIDKYVIDRIKHFPGWLRRILTVLAVIIGWVIFTSGSVREIGSNIGALFGIGITGLVDGSAIYFLRTDWLLLVVCLILSTGVQKRIGRRLMLVKPGRVVVLVINMLLLAACFGYLVTQSYNPFLYFQF